MLLIAMLALGAGAAAAQRFDYARFRLTGTESERRVGPGLYRCIERAEAVDPAINDCLDAAFNRQDPALNRAYRAAMARLPGDAARARLRNDERAWLRTRNAPCDSETVAQSGPRRAWGSLDRMMWRFCALDEIVRRTAWLERLR